MPGSHHALKQILERIEARISSDEVQLLMVNSDEERAKLIEETTHLKVRPKAIKDGLLGDGD